MANLNEDDIAIAAEYALGLLDTAGRASAAARVAADADFAEEVEAWRLRLQPILSGADEPAPLYIWQNISDTLTAPVAQDTNKGPLRLWQGLSFVSASAAAIMAAMLYLQPALPVEQPNAPLIAALGSETGNASLTARYDARNGEMLLTPVSLDTGKLYPELWIIPSDGKAHSLGILAGDHATQIIVPARMRGFIEQGATLAVTPEPAGGAPDGKATGPVLASGKIIPV